MVEKFMAEKLMVENVMVEKVMVQEFIVEKVGIEKYGVEMSYNPMKSTPYVMGEKENSYSKLRTSKVMYMNEKLVPMAMTLSKKITLATRYYMKNEKYASENFQVMNYGIGGRISGHLDSTGTYVITEEFCLFEATPLSTYCIPRIVSAATILFWN